MGCGILVEERVQEREAACAIGDECGTSATSPRRRAPSSVSISFCSTSCPRLRMRFNNTAFFKANLDAFNHGALMRERLGGA